MDRTNARYLTRDDFDDEIDFVSCDVSFISLKLIIPVIDEIVNDEAVVLIKPQFEAGREKISKGVIHDKSVHIEILNDITNFIHDNSSFHISGLTHSPIKGPEGNIEFLCYLTHSDNKYGYDIDNIVFEAHEILGR